MAYKNMNTSEMAAISRHLTGPARLIVVALAMGPALLTDHEAFLALQAAAAHPGDGRLEAADDKAQKADRLHDRLVRGGYGLLTALAELTDDEALAARYLALRDRMYPGGPDMTQQSFLTESAAAEALKDRLTEDDWALLASIPLPQGGNLAEVARAWIAAGVALREAETERAALRQTLGGVTAAALNAARNRWIRAIHMMVASLAYAVISDDDRATLLAKLTEAEAAADLRARKEANRTTVLPTTLA